MGKIDRIKISAEFHVSGNGIWLSAECPVAPEENEVEEFKKVMGVLYESFKTLNPPLQVKPQYAHLMSAPYSSPQEIQVERAIGVTEEDIMSSPDLKTLETYKFLVKGKAELKAAYDTKMKEFTKTTGKKNGKPVLP